jgi:cytochrome c oxidase subunit 3
MIHAVPRKDAPPIGLVIVLATVAMLFAAFTSSYVIRRTSGDWSPVGMPSVIWFNTLLILVSSVTMEVARRKVEDGRKAWVGITTFIGVLFLVGQVYAWTVLSGQGFFLDSNPHAAFVYMLTAIHGLHLLGGIIALFVALSRPKSFGLCAAYWHFVGIVWIWVLLLLWVI